MRRWGAGPGASGIAARGYRGELKSTTADHRCSSHLRDTGWHRSRRRRRQAHSRKTLGQGLGRTIPTWPCWKRAGIERATAVAYAGGHSQSRRRGQLLRIRRAAPQPRGSARPESARPENEVRPITSGSSGSNSSFLPCRTRSACQLQPRSGHRGTGSVRPARDRAGDC
jgi:hypothetical protein